MEKTVITKSECFNRLKNFCNLHHLAFEEGELKDVGEIVFGGLPLSMRPGDTGKIAIHVTSVVDGRFQYTEEKLKWAQESILQTIKDRNRRRKAIDDRTKA